MFSGLLPKNGFSVELSKLRFFFGLVVLSGSRAATGFVAFMIHLVCGWAFRTGRGVANRCGRRRK